MGWSEAVFVLVPVAFMAAVTVTVWQGFATWRARMSIAREAAYRDLAEQATQAQSRPADRLDQAVTELAELRRRVSELERMLKEVA
jgi:Tfp pilus assembly protein PilO